MKYDYVVYEHYTNTMTGEQVKEWREGYTNVHAAHTLLAYLIFQNDYPGDTRYTIEMEESVPDYNANVQAMVPCWFPGMRQIHDLLVERDIRDCRAFYTAWDEVHGSKDDKDEDEA